MSGAAVTFDAATTGTVGHTVSTITFSHTTTGANRLLIVGVAFDTATPTVTSVTYAAVGMTQVFAQTVGSSGTVAMYRLVAPATGANNVVITLSASSVFLQGGAVSFTGVDQTTPLGTPTSTSTFADPGTVDIASATGEVVIDALWSTCCATNTVGAGQTSRVNFNDVTTSGQSLCMSTEPGATTVTMSWSGSTANAIGGVSIKPSAGATLGGSFFPLMR
jgi:hypothetical protein